MISIRDSLRAKGEDRLANVVQSIINDVTSTRFKDHPKVDSCVRFLASFVDRTPTQNAERIMRVLGSTASVTPTPDGIVKLIIHLDQLRADKPEVLDLIERRL